MPDTVMVELPREVARAFVKHERGVTPEQSRRERTPFWIDEWTAVVKVDPRVPEACREALTNPPTPGLREAAQKFVDRWAHPDKLTADQLHRLVDSLEAALSRTPEAKCTCEGFNTQDLHEAECELVQDPPPTATGETSQPVSERERVREDVLYELRAALTEAADTIEDVQEAQSSESCWIALDDSVRMLRRLIAANPQGETDRTEGEKP